MSEEDQITSVIYLQSSSKGRDFYSGTNNEKEHKKIGQSLMIT